MKLWLVSLTVLLLMLAGCSASVPKPTMIERDGVDSLVLTDDHKVTYIKQHGHLDRICASREADAVSTSEAGFSLGVSGVGQAESIGEQSGRGELALGGRSPLVLITRELVYRACELTINLNTDEKASIEVYKMFLGTLERLAQAHLNPGSKAVGSSLPSYSLPSSVPDSREKEENEDSADSEEEEESSDDEDEESEEDEE